MAIIEAPDTTKTPGAPEAPAAPDAPAPSDVPEAPAAETPQVRRVEYPPPAVPAGWYPDPSGRSPLRWFDGRRWTTAVAAYRHRPDARLKALRRVVLVLAVAGLLVLGWPLGGATMRALSAHALVNANFDRHAAPFPVSTTAEYSYSLDAGTYRVAQTAPSEPRLASSRLTRDAHDVDLSARIVTLIPPAEGAATVSIGCMNPKAASLLLTATTDGVYDIVSIDAHGARTVLAEGKGPDLTDGAVLELYCQKDSARGLVSGDTVVRARTAIARNGWTRAALGVWGPTPGAVARFDDVFGIVPL